MHSNVVRWNIAEKLRRPFYLKQPVEVYGITLFAGFIWKKDTRDVRMG